MTERKALFLVCDDVLVALNGKFTIVGVYTGDIVIVSEPLTLNQLVVLFQIETPLAKPFKKLVFQVLLPGESIPRQMDATAAVQAVMFTPPDRTKIIFRWPFLIAPVPLRSGSIDIKILHEEGEMEVGRQWVVTTEQARAITSSAISS